MKKCKQCGEVRPLDNFRNYYGGRKGTYTICKTCESINSRAKYLRRKGDAMSDAEKSELDKIYQLYEIQRACGLTPPQARKEKSERLVDTLDRLMSSYTVPTSDVPDDLAKWLTCELTAEPEYYHNTVYEELLSKYRPVIRYDEVALQVIYDETYKSTLNEVLARFDEYEEKYYNQEDN